MKVKIIDLFAGIGGMRLGTEMAAKELGLETETVFSCEHNEKARQTYKDNFGKDEEIYGDIKALKTDDIARTVKSHDLLLAGFPCPAFSLAGLVSRNSLNRKHGFADRKGNLFPDIVRILRIKKPKSFLLETETTSRSPSPSRSPTLASLAE